MSRRAVPVVLEDGSGVVYLPASTRVHSDRPTRVLRAWSARKDTTQTVPIGTLSREPHGGIRVLLPDDRVGRVESYANEADRLRTELDAANARIAELEELRGVWASAVVKDIMGE